LDKGNICYSSLDLLDFVHSFYTGCIQPFVGCSLCIQPFATKIYLFFSRSKKASLKNFTRKLEGFCWVLDKIIFFYKKMGLAIEGREMELLSFLASLEANRMKGDHLFEESVGDEVVGDRLFSDGANHEHSFLDSQGA